MACVSFFDVCVSACFTENMQELNCCSVSLFTKFDLDLTVK